MFFKPFGSLAALLSFDLSWLQPPVIFAPAPRRSSRRRGGVTYPHSSKRQQERFARQLAMGWHKGMAHG